MDRFSIAFVCSGNRFRSPLAEAFVRRLTLGLPVEVESFGTLDLGSEPALVEARQIAQWFGIDLSEHRTRVLSSHSLADSDLVLGFDDGHIRRAIVDAEGARDRAFTFREIVSLLEREGPVPGRDVVQHARTAICSAAERRTALTDASPLEPIRDPFGGPWDRYTSTAAEIHELSIALAAALFGVNDTLGLPPFPDKTPQPRRFRRRL